MGKQGSNKKSNVEDSIVRKVRRKREVVLTSYLVILFLAFAEANYVVLTCLNCPLSPPVDAGHVERVHLLKHQEQATGQCHEVGSCRAAGRGL